MYGAISQAARREWKIPSGATGVLERERKVGLGAGEAGREV